ncbi:hypothetical protein [uncultured Corynebacterium sp.]|nr:hypothetical protein [uncultured Corynebacterium sp.]
MTTAKVDLVLERHDGAVMAIALHLGSCGYPVEDQLHTLPVERLRV